MSSYNKVIMMGNLTRPPEHKQLPSGQAVCKITIATNRPFKNKNSQEVMQEVCYIDVDVWGPQAESCKKYLDKGSSVLVEGRLKQDSWQDVDGQKRSKHVIVADRVTFVKAGAGATEEDASSDDFQESSEPRKMVASASKRVASSAKPKGKTSGFGELSSVDELEADLPF